MKTCFTTVVSADHYQNYIPLYCLALRTWSLDDIIIKVRGKLSPGCWQSLKGIKDVFIYEDFFTEYPFHISTTNSLRFVSDEMVFDYDYTMITDIDLLILQDPWKWHYKNITKDHPFSGYHGARVKPVRLEICKSWSGEFERVAGGYFCATRQWFDATRFARTKFGIALLDGRCGNYRENDEVILGNIIKSSNMQVPSEKYYPRDLRGLHLGDFKFNKRWINMDRMKNLLTKKNIELYLKLCKTQQWIDTVKLLHDSLLDTILTRVLAHIRSRTGLENV